MSFVASLCCCPVPRRPGVKSEDEPNHQYAIIRPATMAVSQQVDEIPPMTASCRCSLEDNSRVSRARHAGKRLVRIALRSASGIAVNLINRNGLPTYSVAFADSRPAPRRRRYDKSGRGGRNRRARQRCERDVLPQPEQAQVHDQDSRRTATRLQECGAD